MAASTDEDFKLIKELMPLVSAEMLQDFLLRYAKAHPEFKAAWRDWLKAQFTPQGNTQEDIRKTIEAVFNSVSHETKMHGSWEDDVLDWYAVGESMQHLFANMAKEPLPAKLQTALEFLRQLDSYKDFGVEDDWTEVEDIVFQVQELIAGYFRCEDMAESDKRAAVDQLAEIAALPLYRDEELGDLDSLLSDLRLEVLDEKEALRMLDDQIAKADECSRDEPVLRKFEYLLQLKRSSEAEELLHRFREYHDVRCMLVDVLARSGRYDEAMRELDAAVRTEERRPYGMGAADAWRELQCRYAAQFKDKVRLEQLLRTLFCNSGGDIKYYSALRKVVPANRWKDCLEELAGRVMEKPGYSHMALGEIFLREKMPQRVIDAAPQDCEECLFFVCHFAPKLQDISGLLGNFTSAARQFARKCTDRKAYHQLAGFMGKVCKLPGGRECVQALVSEFRAKYSGRPAMMDELKRF